MALTRITGTLKLPDGTLYNGSMFISWGAIPWTADDGTLIPAGPGITSQVKNGAVDVSLQPTDGTTVPTPIYYYVVFRGTGPATVPQVWSVPTSGSPVPLSSVIIPATSGPPIASGIVTLNGLAASVQLFARTNDTNVTLAWSSVTATHTLTAGWTGQLAPARGGTGDDTSAVTGVPKITAGNWTYAATAQDLTSWPSGVSNTEVGYLDGVTSAIQTQLDAKASTSSLSSYLPLAGGTMSGPLLINDSIKVLNGKHLYFGDAFNANGIDAVMSGNDLDVFNANVDATITVRTNASGVGNIRLLAAGAVVMRGNAATSDATLANGDFMMLFTSNTNLQIRAKGSDGVVRHLDLTLAP